MCFQSVKNVFVCFQSVKNVFRCFQSVRNVFMCFEKLKNVFKAFSKLKKPILYVFDAKHFSVSPIAANYSSYVFLPRRKISTTCWRFLYLFRLNLIVW